ncbi:MAG: hypothetical protein QOJ83_3102, partial [Frankiales bacterium]|nr:hypothetical protein [Frankiales bacterium]
MGTTPVVASQPVTGGNVAVRMAITATATSSPASTEPTWTRVR